MEHYCFLAAAVFVMFFACGWADYEMSRRRAQREEAAQDLEEQPL